MKVLYFHQHFTTPEIGGGTRSYEFARKLKERGHQVTMVCGDRVKLTHSLNSSRYTNRGNIDGVDIIQIRVSYSNNDGLLKRTYSFLKYAIIGLIIAHKENYDLLFATSTPLTAGVPGIWMKMFSKKKRKFIFEVRDLWPELPKALGLKNPLLLWGMSILEKLSYNKADGCIGLSPGICEGIKKRLSKDNPITMIPNGCDLNLFNPKKKKKVFIKGVDENDFVVLFSGAHGIANGLDAVLDMAIELEKKNRTNIKIVFIGQGKMKPHLMKRKIDEKIGNCIFLPFMSKLELAEIIASADVGLMVLKNVPAFYYGTSPNKFFDYISSGIPIINNYPGWLSDMILEYNCGEVVKPDNPKLFADKLISMIDNPDKRRLQGINARILAEKHFSRGDLSNQFVDFLEDINSRKNV